MRKGKKNLFRRIIVMLVVFTMTLTGFPNNLSKALAAKQSEVTFKSASYRVLSVGESYDFNLTKNQKGAKYVWTSSEPSVATVSKRGVVTAVALGETTITCKVTNKKDTTILEAKVYVKKASNQPAKSMKITNKIAYLAKGEQYRLNKEFTPSIAYDCVNWYTSNTNVATVDKNGVVTAKANGKVVVKATTLTGKVSASVTIIVSNSVRVNDQNGLDKALADKDIDTIIIKSDEDVKLNISKGDYSNKQFILSISNGSIVVEDGAKAEFIVKKAAKKLNFTINGDASITAQKACNITIDGNSKNIPSIKVNAKNVEVHTKLPVNITAAKKMKLELLSQEAVKTTFHVAKDDLIPEVTGNGTISGKVGEKTVNVQGAGTTASQTTTGGSSSGGSASGGSTTPTVTPVPKPEKIKVDENGLDEKGRMVAYFGTPVMDGVIDDIWRDAVAVSPKVSSGTSSISATFKTLWDDNAIYFLAEVKDADLSAEAANVYERDSVEFFLDENNDKTVSYSGDDLQYRINYLNQKSGDHGDLTRFYPIAKVVDGGYIVEGRISFTGTPENNKVYGIEMQINDAKGGSRIATLNLFDMTGKAFENTSTFGEIILTGKGPDSVSGLNPYKLISLIESANEIELVRYSNGDVVKNLVDKAEALLADKATVQKQIDDLSAELDAAIRALRHNDESFDEKECRQIPLEYKMYDPYPGRIERLDYTTRTYDKDDDRELSKYLHVYLPYGYDANNKEKKYNILYLIHGMSENQHTVFGGEGQTSELMKVVDNLVANGKLEPMIIVTPTWYNDGSSRDMFYLVQNFHNELINDILPAVEGKYNTYAQSTTTNDFVETRDHRAFGGFSMGGGCTWYSYIYCIDYFKYYVPVSMWCLQDASNLPYTGTDDEKKAQYLNDIAVNAGYGKDDIRVFCATGTDDMAYGGMVSLIDAMKKVDGVFNYSADLRKGNFYFLQLEGGTHIWNCVNRYLYNILPDLFETPIKESTGSDWPVLDEYGLDNNGYAVAKFGSPIVDGIEDAIWDQAVTIVPKYNTSTDGTKGTFKAMWDDNALYVLGKVQDQNMSVESVNPYEQDSMEIFMDENNDKTQEFGVDDVQFRVNYENSKTADKGDIARFYTQSSKVDGGYVIEARIEFQNTPVNNKVLGIELQINDGKGTGRVGTLNVFDQTGGAWNDTRLFGNMILKGRPSVPTANTNPYKLFSLIDSTERMDLSEYTNASVLTDAVAAAKVVAANPEATQAEIDAQIVAIKTAIDSLTMTEDAANEKRYVSVPTEYKGESTQPGTIESMTYEAPNASGSMDTKKMNIYLPYGYDPANTEKKYNVFYLMHGGGEDADTLFGGAGESRELKRIIDNMIANGKMDPMIVVTPSFYKGSDDVATFYKELIDIIIPKIETTYNTYGGSGSLEDIKASREHRAFGGFSMGSACTWYVYINCLDYIKYYVPLSGDCWALTGSASSAMAKETAEYLANVAKEKNYGPKDFYLFCATGSSDIAYPNMNPQMQEMKKLTDTFVYSGDITKGNFYFIVADGATHAWNFVNQYIYDILPDLFQ
ncbi:MAG: sugar-binding protein [Clostridiales bacterium]|nr:sugar-binding protein [Clostridiales bacterium]